MITIAVKVQTSIVSINGPNIATKPSRIGSSFLDWPWYIGALPKPASLENIALRTPIITRPQKPPVAADFKFQASVKIIFKEGNIISEFKAITTNTATKYNATIKGTIAEATFAIFVNPPNITNEVIIAKIIPIVHFQFWSLISKNAVDGSTTLIKVSVNWFAVKTPKKPKRPQTAKNTASGRAFSPNPLVI